MDLEVGQVLSLIARFDNTGYTADVPHPYLILKIIDDINAIEVGQLHSLKGKGFESIRKSNKVIFNTHPDETVIDEDSFIQKDRTYLSENYDELKRFRRQLDKLSKTKLEGVIRDYNEYHKKNRIDEKYQVYMDKIEIERLNSGRKGYSY